MATGSEGQRIKVDVGATLFIVLLEGEGQSLIDGEGKIHRCEELVDVESASPHVISMPRIPIRKGGVLTMCLRMRLSVGNWRVALSILFISFRAVTTLHQRVDVKSAIRLG